MFCQMAHVPVVFIGLVGFWISFDFVYPDNFHFNFKNIDAKTKNSQWYYNKHNLLVKKFSLTTMGIITIGPAHTRPSARTPIVMR